MEKTIIVEIYKNFPYLKGSGLTSSKPIKKGLESNENKN